MACNCGKKKAAASKGKTLLTTEKKTRPKTVYLDPNTGKKFKVSSSVSK